MKGFISRTLAALSLGSGILAAGGCYTYHDLVDPCYPKRYEHMANQEIQQCFDPQVNNGHVLDQTIWNYHFETGTDRLTPGGREHLAYIARRRPSPDTRVWLQTAQDVVYDPANPGQMVQSRTALDRKRVQAIEKYLTAQTAGRPVVFEVGIHDPAQVGYSAIPAQISVNQMHTSAKGVLPITSSTGGSTGGGGGGGSGGGSSSGGSTGGGGGTSGGTGGGSSSGPSGS